VARGVGPEFESQHRTLTGIHVPGILGYAIVRAVLWLPLGTLQILAPVLKV
jgi:hypothetical protein